MVKTKDPIKNGIRKRSGQRALTMGQIPFARLAKRLAPPNMPGGEIALMPPPAMERSISTPIYARVLPLVMLSGTLGMMALHIAQNGWKSMTAQPMTMMMPLMMVSSVVGMLVANRNGGKGAQELEEERKDYLRYLADTRDQVRDIAQQQYDFLVWNHPDPHSAYTLLGGRRMWERKIDHPDFLHVRVGLGTQRLAVRLIPPEIGHMDDLEPVCAAALSQFLQTQSIVNKLPTIISFPSFSAIQFETPSELNWGLIRAMIIQITLFHGPDQVLISFITQKPENPHWSWAKWLPHCQHPLEDDLLGDRRLFFATIEEWENSFYDDLNARSAFSKTASGNQKLHHVVIMCDDTVTNKTGMLLTENGLDAVTIIDSTGYVGGTGNSWRLGMVVQLADGWIAARTLNKLERFAQYDEVDLLTAQTYARQITPWRLGTAAQIAQSAGVAPVRVDNSLPALLKIRDATKITPQTVWKYRQDRDRLRVPIGVDPDGSPVLLDIKEGAEKGMGPHGVCIGATGSGKSEFLRTLVLSLVATHSPEQLNLVLVDFKGGATFLGFDDLNHVACVITNLEEEADLVQRMADALNGEMNRRQNKLRDAGNFANVGDYNKARMKGAPLEPFPALLIIVDEFTELLTQFPDFGALFDAIGRLGRSLHVHMLLASQRLSGASTDKIITNLSYKIALKTFTASDSQSIIGTRDAYTLPNSPGSGYMRVNLADEGDMLIRFDSSYVSGPYYPPAGGGGQTEEGVDSEFNESLITFFTAGKQKLSDTPLPTAAAKPAALEKPSDDTKTTMRTIIDNLAGVGLPAHEVWLPPLYYPPAVNVLVNRIENRAPGMPGLSIPIGIIDLPYYQRQDLLNIDFNTNIGLVGAPQSGKSNAIRTMILSAACLNTPEQVQFYCLDFGGGSLNSFSDLPHIGSVFGRLDADAVRRTFSEIETIMRQREVLFKNMRIESMSDYRQQKAQAQAQGIANELTAEKFGDVFLVIDGYATFKQEFEDLIEKVDSIANQGLALGIHMIISSSRWMDIRPNIREKLLSRFELRLGDPTDSEIDSKAARRVPQNRPGRGLLLEIASDGTKRTFDVLVGVPRLDSQASADNLSHAAQQAVNSIKEQWPGVKAPPVRLLPESLERKEVIAQALQAGWKPKSTEAIIGLDEATLSPVILDFDQAPLFLGFAAGESGKTTLIRNIAHSLVENGTPEQTKIVLLDYRRTMLGDLSGDHIHAYISSVMQADPVINEIAEILKTRIPPADVTQKQLRERSWWSGPDYYIIADDYDAVSLGGMSGSPLEPLVPFVGMAKDIGLRIIIMRRSGGAYRASMEPLLKTMREVSTDGIMMNGDRDEDAILGGNIKMSAQPPGRGTLVSRRLNNPYMQVANMPPVEDS